MGELNMVVNDTILLMRRQCERQRVSIRLEAGELPTFRFDPEKIKQALLNVMKNALEVLPDGGEIHIVTSATSDTVFLAITDTGPGINPDDLPLIFEPFFTRKGAGTGLGLSITQRILEEHHGRIFADSSTGSGTVFTLELPLTALSKG
jgi:signal transduction histidine kinase